MIIEGKYLFPQEFVNTQGNEEFAVIAKAKFIERLAKEHLQRLVPLPSGEVTNTYHNSGGVPDIEFKNEIFIMSMEQWKEIEAQLLALRFRVPIESRVQVEYILQLLKK